MSESSKISQVAMACLELCKNAGVTLEEVYKSTRKIFVNPDNRDFTWNGNGEKPYWLRKLEKSGRKPLVKDDN